MARRPAFPTVSAASGPLRALAFGLPLLLAATACGHVPEKTGPAPVASPLERHAIGVEAHTAVLELAAGPGGLHPGAAAELYGFLRAYTDHGHGPLIVSVPAGAGPAARVAARQVEADAFALGIEAGQLSFREHPGAGGPMLAAFQAYEAVAPFCPPVSAIHTADMSVNGSLPNFGCSVRTNLAHMVADPRDLLGDRPLDPGDAERRRFILALFRDGLPTGATRAAQESAAVSNAVQ